MKKSIEGVKVYGIDIGKNTFHVVGLDSTGKPMLHSKFKRYRLLAHFANTPLHLLGMESCPGSQWLARKLQASGHTVKIIPAQFVQPYVKSNKNDMVDAAAIAEAVTRPTIRFTQIRQPEHSARQALHCVRERYDPANAAHQPDVRLPAGVWDRYSARSWRLQTGYSTGPW